MSSDMQAIQEQVRYGAKVEERVAGLTAASNCCDGGSCCCDSSCCGEANQGEQSAAGLLDVRAVEPVAVSGAEIYERTSETAQAVCGGCCGTDMSRGVAEMYSAQKFLR